MQDRQFRAQTQGGERGLGAYTAAAPSSSLMCSSCGPVAGGHQSGSSSRSVGVLSCDCSVSIYNQVRPSHPPGCTWTGAQSGRARQS